MTDYADLIERLEKAEGPDRELFLDCFNAVFGSPKATDNDAMARYYWYFRLLEAGAWTDAALTLVPGGWWIKLESKGDYHHAELEYVGPDEICWGGHDEVHSRNNKTPAIALCIAALRARSAIGGEAK